MLRELYGHPEKGFLGGGFFLYWRGPALVQYWRSFEDLERFARNPDDSHLPAWRRFNRTVGSDSRVGIFHETFIVEKANYEAIYPNVPVFGLAKATEHVPRTLHRRRERPGQAARVARGREARFQASLKSRSVALSPRSHYHYATVVVAWLRRGSGKPYLKIGQSLGAFARPGQGDISPLYVFFEVSNAGREDVEIRGLHVAPKGGGPVYGGPFEGDHDLPHALAPGEAARFWVRAKALAKSLEGSGHGGRPRVRLVVEDGLGNGHEKPFRFRVDEYLRLKDE